MNIFEDLVAAHPAVAADITDPPTGPLPVIPALSEPTAGEHDAWVPVMPADAARLRADDVALPQPPQDPDWRPDGHG